MPLFYADDPARSPALIGKAESPFLKDGMEPAALVDCSEATTLRAVSRESDWTILSDGVLAAELNGLPELPELPDTGASAHPLLWLALCLTSGLGAALLLRKKRC